MQAFETLDISQLSDADVLSKRDQAVAEQRWARQYTLQLIESVPEELWYQKPDGLVSHLAWQVGHLAVSQYGLMLFRQRGRAEGDPKVMPSWLRKQFGRGSVPSDSAESMPAPEQLMQHLASIHEQSIAETAQLTAATLRDACDPPYCLYPNKLGALMLAPIHESIHAGQIGLIRRGHGLEPVR
jgi:hypothetical protein